MQQGVLVTLPAARSVGITVQWPNTAYLGEQKPWLGTLLFLMSALSSSPQPCSLFVSWYPYFLSI